MMTPKTVNALSAMALLSSPFKHATAARGLAAAVRDSLQKNPPANTDWCRSSRVYN
jgi:hypothetical protein